MGFLDQTGLTYFYNKIKEKFVRSINSITPDSSGNVAITNVETANNLTSPDGQTSYDKYIYRTSGGDASLSSGEAELLYIEGNLEKVGYQAEQLTATATNNISVSIDPDIWRASDYGDESDTYTFQYTSNTETWTPALNTYGLTASGVHGSDVYALTSGAITEASVTKATWETRITTSGTYSFIFDGTNWTLNGSNVTLSDYGIEIVGIPVENDTIDVYYTAATPDSLITVTYVKGALGTIYVAKPTSFSATGFNQCDPSTMTLNNMTISNGHIVSTSDTSYICYCCAVGGVTNGYVAYSADGHIQNIGWCADLPQETSAVVTTGQNVTATVASIPFSRNGYVVVVVDDISDICIHPKWSGRADRTYEAYVEPSVITFPTTGTIDSTTRQLPLATYGMPAIDGVADKLDLENSQYVQKIGRQSYSVANLEAIQASGVAYDYDSSYIYYVLTTPIVYNITVSTIYTVNDWGTEEFVGTTIPVVAQTLYGQNLRDKLRTDVLTISPQTLTMGQQESVYTNLRLKSYHITDTITAFPHTIENENITPMTSIANVVFGTPESVVSDVTWETDVGSVTFDGTFVENATTTIDFDIAPILSVAGAEIDMNAIEAEVNSFLDNLQDNIDDVSNQSTAVLDSIEDELRDLQADAAVELKKLQFTNVVVPTTAFISDATYENYPYRAAIALTNVIANMTPDVILGLVEATSGSFAPVAECYNGGVYLYAREVPESNITIPTIICWRANA